MNSSEPDFNLEDTILIKSQERFKKVISKKEDEKEKAELIRKIEQLQKDVDFLKKCWENSKCG